MKNSILYLFTFCFCVHSTLNAQDFEWVKQMGGTGAKATGNKIVTDKWGNVLTLGTYSGTVDFDPGPASYTLNSLSLGTGTTTFLSKLDSSGNFLWAEQLVGGTDLITDKYGNIFVVGTYIDTVDIDPGVTTYTLSGVPRWPSTFILKLDLTGNFIFAKAFTVSGFGYCSGTSILLDSKQNIYTAGGFFAGPIDFDPGINSFNMSTQYVQFPSGSAFQAADFLCKLDSNGVFVYAKKIRTSYSDVSTLATINKNDEIIVLDDYSGGTNWRETPYCYLTKFNANGDVVWSKAFNDFYIRAISTDQINNINVIGAFRATLDVDPGPGTNYVQAGSAYSTFVLQLNNNGAFNWAKSIVVESGSSLNISKSIVDDFGVQYLAGTFTGTVDFDPGDQLFTAASANGNGIILKLDQQGEFKGAAPIGKNAKSSVNSIATDNLGSFYTTGSFTGTVNFDPAFDGEYDLSAFGIQDAFVHKLNGQVITGIQDQVILNNDIRFFPNPTSSFLNVLVNDNLNRAVCRITDVNGRVIREQTNINGSTFSIDVSAQAKGFYILELSDTKTHARVKFVKD